MRSTAEKAVETPVQPEEAVRRKKRRAAGVAECGLGLAIGLAGLAFSRLGQLWIDLDVFSQFTLHFALLTGACAVGLFMPRGKRFTALLLFVAGLVAIGAWPHVASRNPQPLGSAAAGELALKVASFNMLWVNDDADAVRAEIERIDADIVTLIEISRSKKRVLAELKQRYPYQAECYAVDYCKLAILSKLPIASSEARARWEGPAYIRAKLGPEAGGLTVMGVHTIRFPHSRTQFREVVEVGRMLEAIPGEKLLMGDFNATPFSRILTEVETRANLRRLTVLPTWPAQFGLPQIAIDHIFLSRGLRPLDAAHIGESAGSDHYPVIARIAVPRAP